MQTPLATIFFEMSNGQNIIIGEIYPELIIIPGDISSDVSNKNKEVLEKVDLGLNFTNHDKWNMTQSYNQTYNSPDNYVDAVYIIWRNIAVSWGGYGRLLTTYTTNEGKICSYGAPTIGMTLNIGKNKSDGDYSFEQYLILLCHEYGHYLFGADHNFEPYWASLRSGQNQRGIGLMPTYAGTLAMNPHEKYLLGYASYTDIFNNQNRTLPDYQLTDSAYRIPIPLLINGQPNSNPDEFFIIANHQKITPYDKVRGTGIWIYHVKNSSYSQNHMDIVCADGLWQWNISSWLTRPSGLGGPTDWQKTHSPGVHPAQLPIIVHSSVDRVNGRDELQEIKYAYYSDGNYWWDKWFDEYGNFGEYAIGTQTDAWNLGYNQVFSPWSNPPTYDKQRAQTNTAMEIVSKNNGIFSINFYCDQNSCLSPPPSKPQNLSISWNGVHPKLTWESNIEDDVISGGSYKIYRAIFDNGAMSPYSLVTTVSHVSGSTQQWTDNAVYKSGRFDPVLTYYYKVTALDTQVKESVASDVRTIDGHGVTWKESADASKVEEVSKYDLANAYPNPFNPFTTILYDVKEKGLVILSVYDILGKEVASLVNEVKTEGTYSAVFDASNIPSGVYIYTLRVNDFTASKKMIVLK